jgi:hypothetical protein
MVHDLEAWERSDPPVFEYDRSLVPLFSPHSKSLPEVRTQRDLAICRKIYEHSIRIGDNVPGWELTFTREFDMTTDAKAGNFSPLEKWKTKGYKPDEFGRWIGPKGEVVLPFYEGRMVGQFDFSQKGWVNGRGRSAVWRRLPFEAKGIEPQFLMPEGTYAELVRHADDVKFVFMRIGSATNERTMFGCVLRGCGCGDTAPTLRFHSGKLEKTLFITAAANSLAFDYVTRQRVGGLHLYWHIVAELPIPSADAATLVHESHTARLIRIAACLAFIHRRFAPEWLRLKHLYPKLAKKEWKHWWAITEADRLRLRVEIDALCADLYGLAPDDFDWIVRDDPADPKGFWRVDKHLPYRERLTGLALAAFRALKDGKWTAETVAKLSNDKFFEIIGIPQIDLFGQPLPPKQRKLF